MVSNLKRNKQLVEKIKKDIEKSNSIDGKALSIQVRVITGDKYKRIQFTLYYNFKIHKSLKAIEYDKDKIIVGLDLSKLPPLSISAPYDELMIDDKDLREHIFNDKFYWGRVDDDLLKLVEPYSDTDIQKNHQLLEFTKLFSMIKECMNEILSGNIIGLELSDGEFPKLEDRKILPIVIIDLTNSVMKYYQTEYTTSYRSRLKSFDLSSVLVGDYAKKYMRVPKKLLKVSYDRHSDYVHLAYVWV